MRAFDIPHNSILAGCPVFGGKYILALERKIRELYRGNGIRRFIIFLNEGTTLTGALDDTSAVGEVIRQLRTEFMGSAEFYLHVDAAYGGMVYPFTEPDRVRPFNVPEVDSVTVDPYKMGQCPMAEGVFLCRLKHQEYIQRPTGYVQDEQDDTLIGSRSGAYAAACWAVFRAEGADGFRAMHEQSIEHARYLHELLSQNGRITMLPQLLNMVSFQLPPDLTARELKRFLDKVVDKYLVMWSWFSVDPEDPSVHPIRLVKCNITRDVKRSWLESFARAVTQYTRGGTKK